MEKAMKTAGEMMAFGQANLEAMTKSGQIWAAGMQDMSRDLAASAQARIEQTMQAARAVAGVRSVRDAVDLQAAMARAALETAMSESGKLADATMRLTEQSLAPLTARLTAAADRLGATEQFGALAKFASPAA